MASGVWFDVYRVSHGLKKNIKGIYYTVVIFLNYEMKEGERKKNKPPAKAGGLSRLKGLKFVFQPLITFLQRGVVREKLFFRVESAILYQSLFARQNN